MMCIYCEKCRYWSVDHCADNEEFIDVETYEPCCRFHRNAVPNEIPKLNKRVKELEAENKTLYRMCKTKDEKTNILMAEVERLKDIEHKYRITMWLNHGHTQLYGDDGEMQCYQCQLWDYKREPIEKLEQQACLAKVSATKDAK